MKLLSTLLLAVLSSQVFALGASQPKKSSDDRVEEARIKQKQEAQEDQGRFDVPKEPKRLTRVEKDFNKNE